MLCLHLVLGAALPLRGASRSLGIVFSKLPELEGYKAPCFTTVKRWAEKVGYYKLHLPRKRDGGWSLIPDASIQMGDQKCLIILGCPSEKVPIGRPLTLKDLDVLSVKITRKLTGEKISEWLKEVRDNFGNIDSICSDRGPDMLYGIRKFLEDNPHTKHVIDTAHRVANFIKAELENDNRWKSFKSLVTQARRTMQNSTVAGAMPPNLRVKARYMNVSPLIKWAAEKLLLLDNSENILESAGELTKYLGWLQDYRKDIARWNMFVSLVDKAKKLVSTNGMHRRIDNEFLDEISNIPLDREGLDFADDILKFFRTNSKKLDHDKIYLGSSEIIESLFGKLKSLERDQTSFGFTSLVLAAVASVGPLDRDTVAMAISTVRVADIERWSKEQVGISVQSFRKNLQTITRRITSKMGTKRAGCLEGKAMGF